jgi:hypothetical protein
MSRDGSSSGVSYMLFYLEHGGGERVLIVTATALPPER